MPQWTGAAGLAPGPRLTMMSSMSSSTYSPRPTTTPLLALTSPGMMFILCRSQVISPGLRLIQARGKGSSFACGVFPASMISRKR